jgi:phosphoglycolate phosphatase
MVRTYKHIIWDWNGTLFNDVDLCLDVLNRLLISKNLPSITLDTYRNIFTFPVKDYYAKAGFDLHKYSFEELGKEWMDDYEQRKLNGKLFGRANEILANISKNGIEQSILSAYKHETLLQLVNHFGLSTYFTHLTGLDHIYATSKVELGKDLMKKLNHNYSSVLLIGDTVHDFEVAKELNAGCILVADGHQSKEKLLVCEADVYDNLDELMRSSKISPAGFII